MGVTRQEVADMSRDDVIKRIRTALRKRTGLSWSVTGGRGTSWGWITITAPPARRTNDVNSDVPSADPSRRFYMTVSDRALLARVMGLKHIDPSGLSVPASSDYRAEAIERAETGMTKFHPEPYWD